MNEIQKEAALLKEVQSFATKTGSAVIGDGAPRDYDYFALWNTKRIKKLMEMGATDRLEGGPSLDSAEWGQQVTLFFHVGQGENRKKVEVFFVKKRYYHVLQIYTHMLKKMSKDYMSAFYMLQVKEMRVALAESIRDAVIKLDLFKTTEKTEDRNV